MSSPMMLRPMSPLLRKIASVALVSMVCISAPGQCQDGAEWDRARAALIAGQPGAIAAAIPRWRALQAQSGAARPVFDDFAGFLLAYPGLPEQDKLRGAAERSPDLAVQSPARLVAFFDRFPPLGNVARGRYAMALTAFGRPEAADVARAAWHGGSLAPDSEAAIWARWGSGFGVADADARLDALLWDGDGAGAARVMAYASPAARAAAQARMALGGGGSDAVSPVQSDNAEAMREATAAANPSLMLAAVAVPVDVATNPALTSDSGYVFDRARQLQRSGRRDAAAALLTGHAGFRHPALDARRWTSLMLSAARNAAPATAAALAEHASDGFAPGADISQSSYGVRDDYTSLMWLGATSALWDLGDGARAAPLFYRYATAARTPQTRAKGFYWAARALGSGREAERLYEAAAAYPDQYYGLLALEHVGRPIPSLADPAHAAPSADQRAAFMARPIAQAVREVARDADWNTTILFFREIASQAQSDADVNLTADLARNLGRRDLGVIVGQAAANNGIAGYRAVSFPLIPVPAGADWTFVHAITRQESQFSQNAVSHTGALGLMQLEPGTAGEWARKLGVSYRRGALTEDPAYNMNLGGAFFSHLMTVFGGSYPLAVAAYNAGPGNVAKWLRANGDPRTGSIGWVDWVERIPLTETRGYVQHVLENAVVYEAMNPAHAQYTGPNPLSHYLGKRVPG